MSRVICLFLASVMLLAGAASGPKEEVLAAMEAWKQAMLKKDAAALGRLLHDDLTYSHSNTLNETKADVLASIPSGKLNLEAIEFRNTTVRVYGNTAVVKGDIDIQVQKTVNKLNVLQIWVKGRQGWQLVARQSTRLPN